MSDDVLMSDNDFSITSDVFFSKHNITQKSVLSQYQILSALKIHAQYLVSKNRNNADYWPNDLLYDLMEYMKSLNLSLNGRGLKMYNTLWNRNNIQSRQNRKDKEKLEYE